MQARQHPDARRFLVSADCFPQTIAVVQGRAEPLGIQVDVTDVGAAARTGGRPDDVFGVLVQSPDVSGRLHDLAPVTAWAHAAGALVVAASDLLALTLLTPPGEMGADVGGSATRSASASRSATAGRTPRSSPPAAPTPARCRDA